VTPNLFDLFLISLLIEYKEAYNLHLFTKRSKSTSVLDTGFKDLLVGTKKAPPFWKRQRFISQYPLLKHVLIKSSIMSNKDDLFCPKVTDLKANVFPNLKYRKDLGEKVFCYLSGGKTCSKVGGFSSCNILIVIPCFLVAMGCMEIVGRT
jgi:hypothetical protein